MGFKEYLRGDNALTFDDLLERVRMMVWTKYASDGHMAVLAKQLQDAGTLSLLEFRTGINTQLEGGAVSTRHMKVKGKLIINLIIYATEREETHSR